MKKRKVYQDKAFLDVLRQCDRTILKVCYMYTDRSPENIKDMYQDIVCSLWESWPRFKRKSNENTWVYRVAFYTAISKKRHRSVSPMFSPLDDKIYNTLAEENQNSMVEWLYEHIDRLSNEEKNIILLYIDKVPAREIGLTLNLSEESINHRVRQIKDKLKTFLQNENE